jgi:hypothetical protein
MKMILGFLLLIAAVAITGGLYLVIRRPEEKKVDLEKLSSICGQISHSVQQFGDYFVRLYSFAVTKVNRESRTGPDNLSETRSSALEAVDGHH